MVTRTIFLLCIGVASAVLTSSGQAPVTLAPGARVSRVSTSACPAGYAEIVARHFRVSEDPRAAVLDKGTLKITARQLYVEDMVPAPASFRSASGAVVQEQSVAIHNGALEHAACVPYSLVDGPQAMRYEMAVTNDSPASGPEVILKVTADLTEPQYFLDDVALYRTDPSIAAAIAAEPPPAPVKPRKKFLHVF